MSIENKREIIERFAIHDEDTGSPGVQVAILTAKINHLGEHMNVHVKDFHSRRGLLAMVSKRRKLLDYLKRVNKEAYASLIKELDLRR
ncbi:MAG: 30S ribosomal protein S15 [Holosporaceae bacterium]|jgi:small subunit ribosomal protein S15|nr:30S ribosomal protein S15 [Holosporaceae bacterium]